MDRERGILRVPAPLRRQSQGAGVECFWVPPLVPGAFRLTVSGPDVLLALAVFGEQTPVSKPGPVLPSLGAGIPSARTG